MRLPNGYGGISKLPGNRRNPFRVRITIERTEEGKQIFKTIGYYPSRKLALQALAEYNNNPYDLDAGTITLEELWEKWITINKERLSYQNHAAYKSTFKIFKTLHKKRLRHIKTIQIQAIFDDVDKGKATLTKMRSLIKQLFNFAIENDLADKNYADFIKMPIIEKEDTKERIFTLEEINKVWEYVRATDDEFYKILLILLYSGLRISELLDIKTENVFIDECYMIGGNKTLAGKNRKIPIHNKILPFIKELYQVDNKYLIVNSRKNQVSYRLFHPRWHKYMDILKFNHKIHDTRHTAITNLYNAGIDEITIKQIVGHAQQGVTAQVYIHADLERLIEAINKLD